MICEIWPIKANKKNQKKGVSDSLRYIKNEEKTNSTALIPEEYWLDLFREIQTGSVGRKRFYWIWLLFELLYYVSIYL